MKKMTHHEIRELWLNFFKAHQHQIIKSAPLIPQDDKSLLWINAGVAPLKKYFDGRETPLNPRLANIQKCLRTNDIEEVGKTARHHTFFEMMGNFSIGDYFKEEALKLAYELLFSKQYFNFPLNKIYITYHPSDTVCRELWLSLGIKEQHLIPQSDNYWEIGEGPAGPNTEIFYDRGESYDKRGLILIEKDLDNDRYVEIWNIVFSQFNAKAGLKRSEYQELPSKNIDTGAGLERFACLLQNTKTNFETDLFLPIIEKLSDIAQRPYQGEGSFKIIADHLKTLVMAISDGAVLSNEGRGYVLRRLLRRALKHGKALAIEGPFLTKLITPVIEIMGAYYPNIISNQNFIFEIIAAEENKFLETLSLGEEMIEKLSKDKSFLSKEDAFLLYDTYGFPLELQEEYALEHQMMIDKEGFYLLLEEQKERSRKSRKATDSMQAQEKEYLAFKRQDQFVGYDIYRLTTTIIKVFPEGIVLAKTPFYATMGGQEHDIGTIAGKSVKAVIKLPHNQHLHLVEGDFKEGETVVAEIDLEHRKKIIKNHTATHILHQALIDIFGSHVKQQGSYVGSELLRFDFNHFKDISDQEILKVEALVKSYIDQGITLKVMETSYQEAIELGAKALFNEKYGEKVRVVVIGDYSLELCGGTHVTNTKEIGKFMISSITSIGSGIYRVEAFTGPNIKAEFKTRNDNLFKEEEMLKNKYLSLEKELKSYHLKVDKNYLSLQLQGSYQDRIELLNKITELKNLNKELTRLVEDKKEALLFKNMDDLIREQENNLIITENLADKSLRPLLVKMYQKLKKETLLLLNIQKDSATYLVMSAGQAREIIKKLNQVSGGSGGGNPNYAQGGTKNLALLEELIKEMKKQ